MTGLRVARPPLVMVVVTFIHRLSRKILTGLPLTISLYITAQRPVMYQRPAVSSAWVNWMTPSLRPRLTGWWK